MEVIKEKGMEGRERGEEGKERGKECVPPPLQSYFYHWYQSR